MPRYFEIEQELRARIAELAPDALLPSDAQLCAEFGVSRMTARNAVARLAQEGLVYRVRGRGTFVAVPPVHRQANSLLSFSAEMRRQGKDPTSRFVEGAVRAAEPAERSRLRLGRRGKVVAISRLRLADEQPVAMETAVLPAELADGLLTADLEHGSLHRALLALGRVPTAGTASLQAEPAARADAKLLGLRTGAPLLVERRLIFDHNGVPLELTESRYAGDRYRLDVSFDVELGDD
ncbi:MAG: putative GntR-family transcriptional regulator [Conexibacter sp.]|nr:putative GntR-family transcriptional regulator [Conexibacter sp.]